MVGEPGTALVEHDNAAKATELVQPARQTRLVPIILDMGNEARCQNEVGPLAERLVGYVDVAALCVACHALHFGFLAGPAALLAQFRNRWGSLSIVRLLLHLANCSAMLA